VPVGHKDHRGVPMAPTGALGGRQEPFDLSFGQMLAGSR
jgi:hypothetical protein